MRKPLTPAEARQKALEIMRRAEQGREVASLRQAYPLVAARCFQFCRDDPDAPPGIEPQELGRVLTPSERQAFEKWAAGGLTLMFNGFYPWDVERFLEGRPNND